MEARFPSAGCKHQGRKVAGLEVRKVSGFKGLGDRPARRETLGLQVLAVSGFKGLAF